MKIDKIGALAVIDENIHTQHTPQKDEREKGEKMLDNFLPLLIQGHYSDWFFNVLLTNFTIGVKNNLALLFLLTGAWVKLSKLTKTKADDKASNWLMRKLTGFKKEGEKNENSKV